MSRRDDETIELFLAQHHETDRAWLVSESGDPDEAVWIPRSKCRRGERRGECNLLPVHEFEIPEWLATEKGLV